MSRRVGIVAYFFPPHGGAGVQRPVKFTKYLPAFGWEPAVVTGPAPSGATVDPTLGREIPAATEIVRVPGPEPPLAGGTRWRRRAGRWLRRPSAWSRWWVAGVETAQLEDVDVILATMSPFDSAAGTALLARRLGVSWVADLRDPWALDEMFTYPTALHRRLELRRMARSLRSAATIVMNTDEAAAALRRELPALADIPVVVIPNGYDPADFSHPNHAGDSSVFRIVHTGTLHAAQGRDHRRARVVRRMAGGAIGGVDVLPRSHVHLVEAVGRVLARNADLQGMIEVHLAGPSDIGGAPEFVFDHGYLDHGASVALLQTADLLFLPMHGVAPGYRTRIVPAKTYEYLAAGRPLLAAVPAGDAQDLIRRTGNATVCEPSDVTTMADTIEQAVRAWQRIGPAPSSDHRSLLAPFERDVLARRLAEVLDHVAHGARNRHVQRTAA